MCKDSQVIGEVWSGKQGVNCIDVGVRIDRREEEDGLRRGGSCDSGEMSESR